MSGNVNINNINHSIYYRDTYESQMTTLTEMFRTTWQTQVSKQFFINTYSYKYYIQSDDAIDLQQAQYGREIDEHTAMVVTNKLQLDKLSTQLEEATVEHNKPTPLEALGGVTEKTWTSTMWETLKFINKKLYIPFTSRALFDAEHKDSLAAFRAKQDKDKQHVERLTAERLKLIKILEDMQTVVQTQVQNNDQWLIASYNTNKQWYMKHTWIHNES